MYYLKRHIPVELHTFDLKNFQRLPLWVVEYKSLQFIVRLVVGYMLFFYIGGCLLMFIVVSTSEEDVLAKSGHSSALGFSLFSSVMAFTNAGLSPRPSFRGSMDPSMLIIVDVLILAGNTMFPILLRWIIIYLNKVLFCFFLRERKKAVARLRCVDLCSCV
jgi:Trk-type K+ transport system membrane component